MLNESEREYSIPGTYNLQKQLQKKEYPPHCARSRLLAQRCGTSNHRHSQINLLSEHLPSISCCWPPYHTLPFAFESGQMVSFQHLLVCA